MTPERWQQIRELLHAAMQLDAPARSAYLDSHCAGDPALRKEVDSLFAAEAEGAARGAPRVRVSFMLSSMILPFIETVLGLFITLGLFTRWALTRGGLLIAALVFGTALRSDHYGRHSDDLRNHLLPALGKPQAGGYRIRCWY